MTKIKVSELKDAALDWTVAKVEGHHVALHNTGRIYLIDNPWSDKTRVKWIGEYAPHQHWSQGGPIIEREKIDLVWQANGDEEWSAYPNSGNDDRVQRGPTPLIAAMRCFVASRFGDEVEIPKELMP